MGEKDREKLKKKLNQLPDDDFGLLICLNWKSGINFLPEWAKNLPSNKALLNLYNIDYGGGSLCESRLYCNKSFKYLELTKKICSDLKTKSCYSVHLK